VFYLIENIYILKKKLKMEEIKEWEIELEQEEWKNLYFLIDHSSNKHISEEQWKQLLKQNVYHTIWRDIFWDIYIFDYEKNSILPEVKFLDWFSWWNQKEPFNIFWWWFIFIWILVVIFIYFQFFSSSDEVQKNSIVDIATNNLPVTVVDDVLDTQVPITVNNSNIPDFSKEKLQFEYETLQKSFSDVSSENLGLLSKLKDLESNVEDFKNKYTKEDEFFLSIWKDVFERCKTLKSDYCSSLIYSNFWKNE